MLTRARELIIETLLDHWRSSAAEGSRSADGNVRAWHHMVRHLPSYLAAARQWQVLFELVESGFLTMKAGDTLNASSLADDYALLFEGCSTTDSWRRLLTYGVELASAADRIQIFDNEDTALVFARVAGERPRLFDDILSWETLLPSPNARLKVLLALLEGELASGPRNTVLARIREVAPKVDKGPDTDFFLVESFRSMISRDAPELLPLCLDVLWNCLTDPGRLTHGRELADRAYTESDKSNSIGCGYFRTTNN